MDAKEKAFGDIVEALQKQKNQTVLLDKDFQETLKQELMKKYDELYGRVSWFDRFLALRRNPIMGFALTFCLALVCTLGIYSGMYFIQMSQQTHHGFDFGGPPLNQVNTTIDNLPTSKSETSKDYFNGPKHSGGIQFG